MKLLNRITALLLICIICFYTYCPVKTNAIAVVDDMLVIGAIVSLAVATGVTYNAVQNGNMTKWATQIYHDSSSKISEWAKGVAQTQALINYGVSYGVNVTTEAWNEMINRNTTTTPNQDGTVNLLPTVSTEHFENYFIRPSTITATDFNAIDSNNLNLSLNSNTSVFYTIGTYYYYTTTQDQYIYKLYKQDGTVITNVTFLVKKGTIPRFTLRKISATNLIIDYGFVLTNDALTFQSTGLIPITSTAVTSISNADKTPITYVTNNTYVPATDTIKVASGVGTLAGTTATDVVNVVDPATLPTPTTAPATTTDGLLTGINTSIGNMSQAITNSLTGVGTAVGSIAGTLTGSIATTLTGINTAVGSIASVFTAEFWTVKNINFDGMKNLILFSKFPFCIPFDLIRTVKLFAVSASTPVFHIAFSTTYFTVNHTVDLAPYSLYITFFRYFVVAVYTMFLITKTSQFIRW